jgi:hypothetical protein
MRGAVTGALGLSLITLIVINAHGGQGSLVGPVSIQELRLGGAPGSSWQQADLSAIVTNRAPAFQVVGAPFAYTTVDEKARVVYRGADNHIHQLEVQENNEERTGCKLAGGWQQTDLSAIVSNNPPAFPAAGDPFAYHGADRH